MKITDFGLAKLLDYNEDEFHAVSGKVIGFLVQGFWVFFWRSALKMLWILLLTKHRDLLTFDQCIGLYVTHFIQRRFSGLFTVLLLSLDTARYLYINKFSTNYWKSVFNFLDADKVVGTGMHSTSGLYA